jgi:hypothetical protein
MCVLALWVISLDKLSAPVGGAAERHRNKDAAGIIAQHRRVVKSPWMPGNIENEHDLRRWSEI